MLPQNNPDRIRMVFDDHRLVANAGLLLPATLAQRLGLRELVGRHLDCWQPAKMAHFETREIKGCFEVWRAP